MVFKTTIKVKDYIKKLPWDSIFYMFYMEPIVYVLLFSHSLSGVIFKNQVIYQACTTVFAYNETDCRELGNNNISDHTAVRALKHETEIFPLTIQVTTAGSLLNFYLKNIETEVQEYVVNLFLIRTLLESIVPAVCGIFVGSWSDHYGRKPLLLVSMIGFSFTYVITAIICEISRYQPINPWYYILAVVPHSVLGGNCIFSVAAHCFLTDITTTKSRPYRMIFMEIYVFVGIMTGNLLSSYVYAAVGATLTFTISGLFMCAATLFIAVCVPESLNIKKKQESEEEEAKKSANSFVDICSEQQVVAAGVIDEKYRQVDVDITASTHNEADKNKIIKGTVKDNKEKSDNNAVKKTIEEMTENKKDTSETAGLFSYVHIKEMFITCTKSRPCHDRAIIWLATGTMFLVIFVMDGAMTVFYLFVREKFHWNVRDFSFFEAIAHSLSMLGAVIGFLILRKVFKISVVTMAILAFVSETLMNVCRGLAEESWHLYLSIVFGVFRNLGGPMVRTIVSNIVPATDLGKIFSIKNILQSIAPFFAAPLYSFIYKESLTSFPGLFNIVSAALYAVAAILMIFVLRYKFLHKDRYAELLK